jgi:hypothetical protein
VSPSHLVYIDRPDGNTKELVRACVHCAMQRGSGPVYSIDGAILTVTSRAERLPTKARVTKVFHLGKRGSIEEQPAYSRLLIRLP